MFGRGRYPKRGVSSILEASDSVSLSLVILDVSSWSLSSVA